MIQAFRAVSAPLVCAVIGGVLTVGTVVGQKLPQDAAPAANPMAGMNMAGMNMAGMKMAGMKMAGMKMAGMKMGGGATSTDATSSMAGMDMNTPMPGMDMSGTPSGGAPVMNMADPSVAAKMPGGIHLDCGAASCDVVFARAASGTASLLGVPTTLERLSASSAALRLAGTKVTLHKHRSVRSHGLTLTITRISARAVAIHATKAR